MKEIRAGLLEGKKENFILSCGKNSKIFRKRGISRIMFCERVSSGTKRTWGFRGEVNDGNWTSQKDFRFFNRKATRRYKRWGIRGEDSDLEEEESLGRKSHCAWKETNHRRAARDCQWVSWSKALTFNRRKRQRRLKIAAEKDQKRSEHREWQKGVEWAMTRQMGNSSLERGGSLHGELTLGSKDEKHVWSLERALKQAAMEQKTTRVKLRYKKERLLRNGAKERGYARPIKANK